LSHLPRLNRRLARGARLIRLVGRLGLLPLFARVAIRHPGAANLPSEVLDGMRAQFDAAGADVLAGITDGVCGMHIPEQALEGVTLVFGERDPGIPKELVLPHVREHRDLAAHVHWMASGGHYPHLPDEGHPEWTARNQDELVRLIDVVMRESEQDGADSTEPLPM
jgi:hypothetical protein